jgi:tetratricopeptide (TPR) repeat protein
MLTFSPVLVCGFVTYDDDQYVTNNAQVLVGLNSQTFVWAWTTTHAANWHPLTWLSLMLDAQLFGLHTWGFHLTNLLLHLANTLLLFVLMSCLTGATWRSFLVAALFALHPLHVQSVAWVSERKDVLSTFFGLLALLAYLIFVRSPSIGRYLLVVLGMALSLLAKPMLVTLPFVLLLLDYWPLNRWQRGQRARDAKATGLTFSLPWLLLEKVPLLVLSLAACVATVWAQQKGGSFSTLEAVPFSVRVGNALVSYGQYLRQTVFPTDLAVFYPLPMNGPPAWQVAATTLLLVAATMAAVRARQRYPFLLVGWLFYLGTLVPVIGVVQVGLQARADRYTYVPLIGILLALSWGMAELTSRVRPRALLGCLVGAMLFWLMLTSWTEAHYWHDTLTLWDRALQVTEDNPTARSCRGTFLLEQGDHQQAEQEFRAALCLRPEIADPYYGLGLLQAARGETTEAIQSFRKGLALRPDSPDAYNNLGVCLMRQGQRAEAISCFQEALRLRPNWSGAQDNLRLALRAEDREPPK